LVIGIDVLQVLTDVLMEQLVGHRCHLVRKEDEPAVQAPPTSTVQAPPTSTGESPPQHHVVRDVYVAVYVTMYVTVYVTTHATM
jgi:hypothetical protein